MANGVALDASLFCRREKVKMKDFYHEIQATGEYFI